MFLTTIQHATWGMEQMAKDMEKCAAESPQQAQEASITQIGVGANR